MISDVDRGFAVYTERPTHAAGGVNGVASRSTRTFAGVTAVLLEEQPMHASVEKVSSARASSVVRPRFVGREESASPRMGSGRGSEKHLSRVGKQSASNVTLTDGRLRGLGRALAKGISHLLALTSRLMTPVFRTRRSTIPPVAVDASDATP